MSATMLADKSVDECLEEMRASVRRRPARESNGEEFDAAATERIGSPSIDDAVRQGDLYLVCIEELPKGRETDNRQVVPGNTQGSRHVLEGDVTIVKDVSFKNLPATLVGPAFRCDGDVTVTHPEHGWKILPAGTCWQAVYQLAYDVDVIRRARD